MDSRQLAVPRLLPRASATQPRRSAADSTGPVAVRVVDDRTPMVVEFAGVGEFGLELRLVTYQGFPAAVSAPGRPPW